MNAALALQSGIETRWTITNGPLKGTVRILTAAQFTLGRSTDCEFAIAEDPKISRRHATVALTPEGYEIVCLNESNPVLVNGREIQKARLKAGDVVTVGSTDLKFNPGHPTQLVAMPQAGFPASGPAKRGRAKKVNSQSSKRLLIYAIVGAFFLYLVLSPSKKKEVMKLRSEQQVQADIEASTKLKEVGEAQNAKRVDGSINSRQAQENYIRGFRDYREGQYERALVSFQACLALNPEHALCTRYLRLGQRKFNEVIQYQMVTGRRYRDQNQFKSCRSAFRNVMVMIKDASSPTYKEAKANYEACNAFVEGRF